MSEGDVVENTPLDDELQNTPEVYTGDDGVSASALLSAMDSSAEAHAWSDLDWSPERDGKRLVTIATRNGYRVVDRFSDGKRRFFFTDFPKSDSP